MGLKTISDYEGDIDKLEEQRANELDKELFNQGNINKYYDNRIKSIQKKIDKIKAYAKQFNRRLKGTYSLGFDEATGDKVLELFGIDPDKIDDKDFAQFETYLRRIMRPALDAFLKRTEGSFLPVPVKVPKISKIPAGMGGVGASLAQTVGMSVDDLIKFEMMQGAGYSKTLELLVKGQVKTSSGALLTTTAGVTTTVIGNYPADMQLILRGLGVGAQNGNLKEIVKGFAQGNPGGFNFLNVSEGVIKQARGKGGFFNYANTKWVDAAVKRGDKIIVASAKKFMYRADGSLNGFGKEVSRLVKQHGYKWSKDGTQLMPPAK